MSSAFKPIQVGRSTPSNRFVLAPMTRMRSPNHIPTDLVTEYYRQRAAGEPGSLLIAEATFISPQAGGHALAPGIWSEEQIQAWKKVTEAVHKEGSFIYVKLWALVVAPSAIAMKGGAEPKALTKEEIKEYVQWYAQAAKNAIAAGFDGVEIHSATGCLPDQFLHENSNQRTDEYGGSIGNHARFLLEVVDAAIKEVGADRTGARFSPWEEFGDVDPGISPIPQWSYITAELEKRALEGNRLSYIHIVEPRFVLFEEGGHVDRALNNFFRDIWQGILIRAGAFGHTLGDIEEMTAEDDKLLIGLGRYYFSNPDLIQKIKYNKPLDPYNRDTFYWDGRSFDPAIGYTKNVVAEQ